MKKIWLNSLLFGMTLLANGCGSDKSETSSTAPAPEIQKKKSSPKIGGKVTGPCTLAGDIRSFEIGFNKSLSEYNLVADNLVISFARSETMALNSIINGVQHDMNFKIQGTKLIGSEKLVNQIELELHFTDNSKCSVSLWVANE